MIETFEESLELREGLVDQSTVLQSLQVPGAHFEASLVEGLESGLLEEGISDLVHFGR